MSDRDRSFGERASTETVEDAREKPRFGVRLPRGIVTHFNNEPLLTYDQADQARQTIGDVLGEWGEVEKVFVL